MLAHFNRYAERYYGEGVYMVSKIKADIAGVDTSSWGEIEISFKLGGVVNFCNESI